MKRILGSLSVLSLVLVVTAMGYSQSTTAAACCKGDKPACCDKATCCKGNHAAATTPAPAAK